MLLGILLTFHIIVCIALIGVVLIQRSEGGALGMGGGPSGFMTARGAGDLLTRTTWILASVFFALSLALTALAGRERGAESVVDRVKIDSLDPSQLNRQAAPAPEGPTSPQTAPADGSAAPIEAPTPQLRNPLLGETEGSAPAPTNP
ncbi:MAG: preprotein translocase subunit SecG [Phenylobacterium sp.]|uniref:preprotein translocase subunit SecG n=1 Tax=Phenylobacterium sp. TaxID=1871053 RepID=UPI00391AA3C1